MNASKILAAAAVAGGVISAIGFVQAQTTGPIANGDQRLQRTETMPAGTPGNTGNTGMMSATPAPGTTTEAAPMNPAPRADRN